MTSSIEISFKSKWLFKIKNRVVPATEIFQLINDNLSDSIRLSRIRFAFRQSERGEKFKHEKPEESNPCEKYEYPYIFMKPN